MATRTVEHAIGDRTFTVRADVSPGHPGGFWDPPEPPEVNITSVHEGDAEIAWEDFETLLEALVGTEHAGAEVERIENALLDADAAAHESDAEDAARREAGAW